MHYIGILLSRILAKNDSGETVPKIVKKVTTNDPHGDPWKSHMDIVKFVIESAPNNDSLITIMYPPIIDIKSGQYPMCEQKLKEEYFNALDEARKELAIRELLASNTHPDDPLPEVHPRNGYYYMYIPEAYRMRFTWPTSMHQVSDTVKGMMYGSISHDELRILRIKDPLIGLVTKGFIDDK
jgi:hypothetical protein